MNHFQFTWNDENPILLSHISYYHIKLCAIPLVVFKGWVGTTESLLEAAGMGRFLPNSNNSMCLSYMDYLPQLSMIMTQCLLALFGKIFSNYKVCVSYVFDLPSYHLAPRNDRQVFAVSTFIGAPLMHGILLWDSEITIFRM
jgi:hypothetical protein